MAKIMFITSCLRFGGVEKTLLCGRGSIDLLL